MFGYWTLAVEESMKKKSCTFRLLGYRGLVQIVDNVDSNGAEFVVAGTGGSLFINVDSKVEEHAFPSLILHELFEGSLFLMGLQYEPTEHNSYDMFFMFNHGQLTTLVQEVHLAYGDIMEGFFKRSKK